MIFLLLTLSSLVEAKYINDLSILGIKYKDIRSKYIHEINLNSHSDGTIVEYGNKEFGFLKAKVENKKIKIFAPYYFEDVEFLVNNKVILTKQFKDPTPVWIKKNWKFKKQGSIDTNFFLINLNIYKRWKSNKLNALVVLNKRQEIVWCHILNKGIVNKSMRYMIFKKYNNKIYVVYRNIKDGQRKEKILLEKIDLLSGISEIKQINKIKPHHDFIVKDEVVFFLKKDNKWLRNKHLDTNKWQGDAIYSWNMKNGSVTQHWSSFEDVFPKISKTFNTFLKKRRMIEEDFTHANSIDMSESGDIIVSLRNLSSVYVLDKDYKLKKVLKNKEVYRQHHVQQIGEYPKEYLVFNNRKRDYSSVEIRDENFNLIKKSSFKYGKIFAPIRSSAHKIGHNVVSLFVGNISRGKTTIVEFDYDNLKEKGRIDIKHPAKGSGFYRVIGFDSLIDY